MATRIDIIHQKEIKQFTRFLVVGASGTLVDFGGLTILKMLGMATLAANTISFGAGFTNNFVLNRLWTFEGARAQDWKGQFVQFLLVSLVGLALNNAIVWGLEGLFAEVLSLGEWSYVPAKMIATGVVVFWNYFANRTWTFQSKNTVK